MIVFNSVNLSNLNDQRWLHWLNANIFPTDVPPRLETANWFLGWNNNQNAVAFCGWMPYIFNQDQSDENIVGFHYRAGILQSYRGQGLQKQMITLREDSMKELGIIKAVTYTEVYSVASMCSLINSGYRPYEASDLTCLTTLDRYKNFVHWSKKL